MDDPMLPEEDYHNATVSVQLSSPLSPRNLLHRLSTACLAELYRFSTRKVDWLRLSVDPVEDVVQEDTPENTALRASLVEFAETRIREAGAKGVVGTLKLAQLKEAMALVPIDHGQNNPNSKTVLQKRFTEVLFDFGAQEYAKRFVHSIETMGMLCRASGADEETLEETLALECTDLEMDDGDHATKEELEQYQLEELQKLLGEHVNRLGLELYLSSFPPSLLRRVCRNLGVDPSEERKTKQNNINKLIDLIFNALKYCKASEEDKQHEERQTHQLNKGEETIQKASHKKCHQKRKWEEPAEVGVEVEDEKLTDVKKKLRETPDSHRQEAFTGTKKKQRKTVSSKKFEAEEEASSTGSSPCGRTPRVSGSRPPKD